ncbi:unnamed protein product [Heterobilharzia americana]|nr:unnamed protein product [Heterobilharzia americana]CAH8573965.1 unnamed protein product [Heterobilharzia americana]
MPSSLLWFSLVIILKSVFYLRNLPGKINDYNGDTGHGINGNHFGGKVQIAAYPCEMNSHLLVYATEDEML